MNDEYQPRANRSWPKKFADAGRGVKVAIRGEVSFHVHLLIAVIVLLAGVALGVSRIEWCLLVLSIATVLAAEIFNSAIERVARAVTDEQDSNIRDALDMASGAVLVVAVGAAVVGLLVLGARALELVYA